MRKKFCPKCGKAVERFYNNLCKDCFLSKVSVVEELPDKLIFRMCKFCNKIFVNNESATSIENAIDKFLTKFLEKSEIKSATYRITDNMIRITTKLKIQDLEKEETKDTNLITKIITCKFCSLKSIGYYQSILQLRGPEIIVNEMLEDVKNKITVLNQYDDRAFISKIENVKNGVDVYIGSKYSANQIAQKLKNKFKAKINISRKLGGSIRGRKVYRDTILISVGE